MNIYSFKLGHDPSKPEVSFNTEMLNDPKVSEKMEMIGQAVMELFDLMKKNPDHYTSISPNNLHINFSSSPDEKVAQITKVELVDTGVNLQYQARYEGIESFKDYLQKVHEQKRLEKYLSKDRFLYDRDSLKQWQSESPYKPDTVAGLKEDSTD